MYADLLHYVKNAEHSANVKYFRLEQLQEEFDFTTPEAIAENRRFRLLQLREKQIPEFAGLRMIPPNENEIATEILTRYSTRKRQEASSLLGRVDTRRKNHSIMLQNVGENFAPRFFEGFIYFFTAKGTHFTHNTIRPRSLFI